MIKKKGWAFCPLCPNRPRKGMNSPLKRRSTIRDILPVLGLLLGAVLSAPRDARASTGNSFLESIGIGIAVGTVLGASTLPFYSQPGTQLINLAYGASAGAVVGLGAFLYELAKGSNQGNSNGRPSDDDNAHFAKPFSRSYANLQTQENFSDSSFIRHLDWQPHVVAAQMSMPVYPATIWMPLVSLTW